MIGSPAPLSEVLSAIGMPIVRSSASSTAASSGALSAGAGWGGAGAAAGGGAVGGDGLDARGAVGVAARREPVAVANREDRARRRLAVLVRAAGRGLSEAPATPAVPVFAPPKLLATRHQTRTP